jgi:hypothetical protein
MRVMLRVISFVNLIFVFAIAGPDAFPERIILNLTENPATSMAVTWRSEIGVVDAIAQITEAAPTPSLEENAVTVKAITEQIEVEEGQVKLSHSVIFRGLNPNSLYAYRVGNDSVWSEWNQFKTARKKPAPFTFVYFGDPQNDITNYVSRIFREAYKSAPDAAFWLFTGDLVSNSTLDSWWSELFYASGWIFRVMPGVMLPGNHGYPKIETPEGKTRILNRFWRPNFTLPENGPEGLAETSYFIDYQGVRFIMLNGNEKLQEQADWLRGLLANNSNTWTIAAMHQPIYSTGKDRDNPELRELFMPLYDEYSVDLILQGHDHTYGRTFKLKNGEIVNNDESGTVYVVSVSGPKVYPLNPLYRHLMAKFGTGNQLFQVITIKKNVLYYESRLVTGELYDSFELIK